MSNNKITTHILWLYLALWSVVHASSAQAYHDPCQPHSKSPRPAPAAYNKSDTIEKIIPPDPSGFGIWHIVISGEMYRICSQTYLAVIKPDGRKEKIPPEEIHNNRKDPFSVEFVEGNGVKVITALTFHDP